jgi:hypothetical protein
MDFKNHLRQHSLQMIYQMKTVEIYKNATVHFLIVGFFFSDKTLIKSLELH